MWTNHHVENSRSQSGVLYSVRVRCKIQVLVPTIPFYSLLFPSILFYSLLFSSIPIFDSLLFPSLPFSSLLFPSLPFSSLLSLLFPSLLFPSPFFPSLPFRTLYHLLKNINVFARMQYDVFFWTLVQAISTFGITESPPACSSLNLVYISSVLFSTTGILRRWLPRTFLECSLLETKTESLAPVPSRLLL